MEYASSASRSIGGAHGKQSARRNADCARRMDARPAHAPADHRLYGRSVALEPPCTRAIPMACCLHAPPMSSLPASAALLRSGSRTSDAFSPAPPKTNRSPGDHGPAQPATCLRSEPLVDHYPKLHTCCGRTIQAVPPSTPRRTRRMAFGQPTPRSFSSAAGGRCTVEDSRARPLLPRACCPLGRRPTLEGRRLEVRGCDFYTFQDGQVTLRREGAAARTQCEGCGDASVQDL
jgi:hypothetical protein